MLPREKRLNLKKDFRWVASGQRLESNLAKMFFRFGDNTFPRIGIATSKANFKKAVDRNRARRLISKGFEDFYPSLPQGLNMVVLPKSEVLKMGSEEVGKILEEALEKQGLFIKKNS